MTIVCWFIWGTRAHKYANTVLYYSRNNKLYGGNPLYIHCSSVDNVRSTWLVAVAAVVDFSDALTEENFAMESFKMDEKMVEVEWKPGVLVMSIRSEWDKDREEVEFRSSLLTFPSVLLVEDEKVEVVEFNVWGGMNYHVTVLNWELLEWRRRRRRRRRNYTQIESGGIVQMHCRFV